MTIQVSYAQLAQLHQLAVECSRFAWPVLRDGALAYTARFDEARWVAGAAAILQLPAETLLAWARDAPIALEVVPPDPTRRMT